jgi:predicted Rossmann fold nucleotide-binding protein DprA/Smf involved in DNA uptake
VSCQQWQDVATELPPDVAARLLPPPIKQLPGEPGVVAQMSLAPHDLTPQERAVWELLSADEAVQIDALVEATGQSIPELTSALLGLEMRELIRQLPGRSFVRKL